MVRAILLIGLMLFPGFVLAQHQWNLPVLSNWDDDNIPGASYGSFSECWGYASNGHEYAFLASSKGTYIFNITDPYAPEVIDYFPTRDTVSLVINKDYAVYDHYLYAVSDQGQNSLQIFDLQYLPDSVVKVYDSDAISKRCHTLFVERDRLYMCYNTRPDNSYGPMDIFSLADPLDPQYLGTVSHPGFFTVHEVFVKNDTAYCANGYNGLWVYNVSNPAAPSLITVLDVYPQNGYNHSAWLTDDSRTMVFTDENHGLGVKVFDLADIHDPQPLALIRSNLLQVTDSLGSGGSIAHNPYIRGNLLFISYYHDGVQVYDITNPAAPRLAGWHDTDPQNTSYASYGGCWGLYPFLPSGNIIASDMNNGLFILDGSRLNNGPPALPVLPGLTLGSNPVTDDLEIHYSSPDPGKLTVEVFDVSGKRVKARSFQHETAGMASFSISLQDLSSGIYIIRASDGYQNMNQKLIKTSR